MGYRTCFVYREPAGRAQRSLERWLCYFLRPLLPREVAWRFREAPNELVVELEWDNADAFAAWCHSDQCRDFREAHGDRPRPRHWLRAPRLPPPGSGPEVRADCAPVRAAVGPNR